MNVPFHPVIVHFPLVLAFIIPFLMLIFILMIKKNKMAHQAWLIIVGMQIALTVTGYVAMNAGENEEEAVEKIVNKKIIQEHEEAAEIFVGSTVVILVLSLAAFFLKKEIQIPVYFGVCLLSLVSCYLAYKSGSSGGEMVYRYGAAGAYLEASPQSLLPTSQSTDEDNESLKADENDYGSSDEIEDVEDEELKQED